jgi:hypothetical protein
MNFVKVVSLLNNLINLPMTRINEMTTNTTANPSNSIFRFINNAGRLGIKSGSLKYLIVESKTTLLIEAANPLRV